MRSFVDLTSESQEHGYGRMTFRVTHGNGSDTPLPHGLPYAVTAEHALIERPITVACCADETWALSIQCALHQQRLHAIEQAKLQAQRPSIVRREAHGE